MANPPRPKSVVLEGDYYHVRFRDPSGFDQIRTPAWASKAAGDVVDGAKVRMGRVMGSDEWEIQSVLVPKREGVGEKRAQSQAQEIVEKIAS